jgi:hypothetical protein
MDVAPEQMAVRPIELWLDLPGTPGWKGLAHVEEQVCLLLNDTTALVRGRADKPLQTSGRRRRAGQ